MKYSEENFVQTESYLIFVYIFHTVGDRKVHSILSKYTRKSKWQRIYSVWNSETPKNDRWRFENRRWQGQFIQFVRFDIWTWSKSYDNRTRFGFVESNVWLFCYVKLYGENFRRSSIKFTSKHGRNCRGCHSSVRIMQRHFSCWPSWTKGTHFTVFIS